jgi:hypothetical protein
VASRRTTRNVLDERHANASAMRDFPRKGR